MNRLIKFKVWDKKFKRFIFDLYFNSEERFIPLQFTGLKDKTGREIYEGDIVELELEIGEILQREIVFSDGYFGIKRDNNKAAILIGVASSSKIIGNIFENPELLPL